MKKVILKLLLASVFITSFSVHAVDIEQVLDATDNLNIKDQAEILFKTAIVKTIDVNKALGVSKDRLELAIPFAIALTLLPSISGLSANIFIDNRVPNSISHLNEKNKIYNYKANLNNLNHQQDRANRLMKKTEQISGIIDDYKDRINSLPKNDHSTKNMISNSIARWEGRLAQVDYQFNRIPRGLAEERYDVQKKLDAAKHELRLMQTKKGFFYKIGRSAYRLKGTAIFTTAYLGTAIALTDSVLVIFSSEKAMNRTQERLEREVEELIEKSNALFLEDYDI